MKGKIITKDMLIGNIVNDFPEASGVLFEFGIHCVGCHVATWETLEQGAQAHGIDIDKLVKTLNERAVRQR